MRLAAAALLVPFIAAVLAVAVSADASADFPIKHVVVLMEENRSFDHMCGFLKVPAPAIPLEDIFSAPPLSLPATPGLFFAAQVHLL